MEAVMLGYQPPRQKLIVANCLEIYLVNENELVLTLIRSAAIWCAGLPRVFLLDTGFIAKDMEV